MTKTLSKFLDGLLFFVLVALSLILCFNKALSLAVIDGFKLWFACVLPSVFPYFFITAIMTGLSFTGKISRFLSPVTKRLFNTGGITGYAFFISLISGYPVGAKTVADLKENNLLGEAEAVRASTFCSTSSPMFLISSVGSIMFNSATFGLVLFLVHFLSAILMGITFSFYKRKEKPLSLVSAVRDEKINLSLYETTFSAVTSVLVVGGLITVFYILTEVLLSVRILVPLVSVLEKLLGDKTLAEGIVFGILETTRGYKAVSGCGITFLTLPVCAFFCGFGGLSVIAQSLAYLKKAKIKTAPFILAKILQAVLSFVLGLIFSSIFFGGVF
ncbi:MAG: hypothetical protein E7382_01470 [Clostridiales bacterium]|nr:hypothetical protein [Clostridiales bacterium]